jgi:DNA-binding transcriptional LysR family regulator
MDKGGIDLRRIDLNLLVAFDALLDERSVTRAAERLFVGQSAMSATLGRLRNLINDPILIRQGRQLVPTPVAEGLVGPIKEILDLVSSTLVRQRQFDPATDHRTFSIVASDYMTLVFLHPLLARLSIEAPNIKLNIRPISDSFAEDLRNNRADLLITAKEAFPGYVEFPHQFLFQDRYVCAADASHPDLGENITLEQFKALPYVASRVGQLPAFAESELDRRGIARNVEITTTFLLCGFLLRGTRLISLLHERLGNMLRDQLNIRLLEPPFERIEITETMIWTQRHADDPGHVWLRNRLASQVEEQGA